MESNESKELKLLYIEEELSQHGEWLCDILAKAIEKRKLIRTSELHDSLDYSSFHEGENPGLKVNFLSYGRVMEIKGRNPDKHVVDTNIVVWGQKKNRRELKKNTNWYARNMFGGLNRLISSIMYGLSDIEIQRLKGILENRSLESKL